MFVKLEPNYPSKLEVNLPHNITKCQVRNVHFLNQKLQS